MLTWNNSQDLSVISDNFDLYSDWLPPKFDFDFMTVDEQVILSLHLDFTGYPGPTGFVLWLVF